MNTKTHKAPSALPALDQTNVIEGVLMDRFAIPYLFELFKDAPLAVDLLNNVVNRSCPDEFSLFDKGNAEELIQAFGTKTLADLDFDELEQLEDFYATNLEEISFANYAGDHPEYQGDGFFVMS